MWKGSALIALVLVGCRGQESLTRAEDEVARRVPVNFMGASFVQVGCDYVDEEGTEDFSGCLASFEVPGEKGFRQPVKYWCSLDGYECERVK